MKNKEKEFILPFWLAVFLAVFLLGINSISAQTGMQVTGVVTDTSGEPMIGVSVLVKGSTVGTVTDLDGNFRLQASRGSKLKVSYVGYKEQEIEVTGSVLKIVMHEDAEALDEVVVVGYGTQKKVNLTGAVSAVSGEEISKRPVANTSTMLQGQMPGLRVTSDKGQPGNESVQFRVRGQGTYSSAGSNPLILINGVEGDLNTLDPNMIESVSVLKDAASASIYGSRAANGVILVTTKNGAGVKDRVSVTYNGNFAAHTATNLLDLVWDSPTYMKYFNMAKDNSKAAASERYTQEMIDAYTNPTDKIKYPSFDWIDYMFSTAFVHQHNLSVAGTTGRTSYNASLSMIDQPGTMKGQTYERYNASLDLTSQVNDWIKFGMYFSGSRSYRQYTRQGDTDAYLSTISQAPTYMPWLPDDGSGIRRYTYRAYVFEGNNKNMPAIIETENFRKDINTDVNAQAWLDIKLMKGLSWYTKGAVKYKQNHYKDWRAMPTPVYYYHDGSFGGNLNTGGTGLISEISYNTYFNLYTYLKYDWSSPAQNHDVSAMAGYSQENYRKDLVYAYRQYYDFPLQEIEAGNASTQETKGKAEEWGLVSAFFRLNYAFKQRYLLEANARYDGTSRIASGSRWGFFPSFSLGWRVTEEEWVKNWEWDWLNSFKLRGSYGILGNQNIDLYSYYALVAANKDYSFDNSSLSSGVAQTVISNRKLKWETTAITDIGFDMTLFNGLNVIFDWYQKRTYDILRKAQGNDLLGLTAPYINEGEMLNTGIELGLSYNNVIRSGVLKGLTYSVGAFIDRSRNELVKYGADYIEKGTICREGLPYESFFGLEAIGIFKDEDDVKNSPKQFNDDTQPGDIKFRDVDGSGYIDNEDRVVIDGRFPDFEYSLNLSASWKGFDLSLLGQGVQGAKHFVSGWGLNPFYQGSPISYDYIKHMWTEENPNGKYPRLYYGTMGGVKNTRESTYWIKDASYFRLKNLTIGYTLPSSLTEKVKIEKLRVYFSGDNLLTFSKFPQGGDPERNYTSKSNTRLVYYPQNRIISFGLNVEF